MGQEEETGDEDGERVRGDEEKEDEEAGMWMGIGTWKETSNMLDQVDTLPCGVRLVAHELHGGQRPSDAGMIRICWRKCSA